MNDRRNGASAVSRRAVGAAITGAAAGFIGTAALTDRGTGNRSAAAIPAEFAAYATGTFNAGSIYWLAPSGDTTGATDGAAANALLAAGNVVNLMPGQYYINAPISIPPYGVLTGPASVSLNFFTGTNFPVGLPRITAVPGYSHPGLIQIQSQTPGGWSTPAAGQTVKGLFLDGSNLSAGQGGIALTGPVYDTHLEDLFIYKGNDGLIVAGQTESGIGPTYPYHQRYERVSVIGVTNIGFNLTNITDSTFVNCLAFSNGNNNWQLQNNSNSTLVGCRAEWSSSGNGFVITGSGGSVMLTGCTTDQNAGHGLYVTSASPQATQGGGVIVSGGKYHADRGNGIRINGSSVPVTITGVNVESGQNPNDSNYYPDTAIHIASCHAVTVGSSTLQGITTSWSWDSNGALARSGCIGATGNPGSQSFTRLADI